MLKYPGMGESPSQGPGEIDQKALGIYHSFSLQGPEI